MHILEADVFAGLDIGWAGGAGGAPDETRALCSDPGIGTLIPRRPAWSPGTTPEQLDADERAAFLNWRRDLAALEQDMYLCVSLPACWVVVFLVFFFQVCARRRIEAALV